MDNNHFYFDDLKPLDDSKYNANKFLSQFELQELLGRGTFGKVRLATHIQSGEKVAIKILDKDKIQNNNDKTRVEREIKILKMMYHNNIIKLYTIIQTFNYIYIVMELAENRDLSIKLKLSEKFSEKQARYYFQQIISGVEYIHKNKVVHRDLKPENIMLNYNNEVKIADFGLSYIYTENQIMNIACGSPCYACPEMISKKGYKGPNADIWSCGVILYYMVCGVLPFDNKQSDILYKLICEGKYRPFSNDISYDCRDLIEKIFNINPQKRISLERIKVHPWFTGESELISLYTQKIDQKKKKSNKNVLKNLEYQDLSDFEEVIKDEENNLNDVKKSSIKIEKNVKNQQKDLTQLSLIDQINMLKSKLRDPKKNGLLLNEIVIPIDEEIISIMASKNYDHSEVRESILFNKCNHLTTCYYLLLKRKIKEGFESHALIGSKLFQKYYDNKANNMKFYNNNIEKMVSIRVQEDKSKLYNFFKETSFIKDFDKKEELKNKVKNENENNLPCPIDCVKENDSKIYNNQNEEINELVLDKDSFSNTNLINLENLDINSTAINKIKKLQNTNSNLSNSESPVSLGKKNNKNSKIYSSEKEQKYNKESNKIKELKKDSKIEHSQSIKSNVNISNFKENRIKRFISENRFNSEFKDKKSKYNNSSISKTSKINQEKDKYLDIDKEIDKEIDKDTIINKRVKFLDESQRINNDKQANSVILLNGKLNTEFNSNKTSFNYRDKINTNIGINSVSSKSKTINIEKSKIKDFNEEASASNFNSLKRSVKTDNINNLNQINYKKRSQDFDFDMFLNKNDSHRPELLTSLKGEKNDFNKVEIFSNEDNMDLDIFKVESSSINVSNLTNTTLENNDEIHNLNFSTNKKYNKQKSKSICNNEDILGHNSNINKVKKDSYISDLLIDISQIYFCDYKALHSLLICNLPKKYDSKSETKNNKIEVTINFENKKFKISLFHIEANISYLKVEEINKKVDKILNIKESKDNNEYLKIKFLKLINKLTSSINN